MSVSPLSGHSATTFKATCVQCGEEQPIVFVMPADGRDLGRQHTWTCVCCGAPLEPELPHVARQPPATEST